MDTLSQITLGAVIGVAVMGRRTAVWKAAVWGGLAGTLPDTDVFLNFGDPILDMVRHRAESHALFYLTLLAPFLAWGIAKLHGETVIWKRWWLAIWLVLVTHPLLDLMTVYGTQLLIPFSSHPFGVGSIFIIDPLYTLPLLVGLVMALWLKSTRGLRWNQAGLAFSMAYLAWSVVIQSHMLGIAEKSLQANNIQAERILVTPTAFNTVLWRFVAMTPDYYYEGFSSLLDDDKQIKWLTYPRCDALIQANLNNPSVKAIADFSHGFYTLTQQNDRLVVTDLRMGQQPFYFFSFDVGNANQLSNGKTLVTNVGQRPNLDTALPWLWARIGGENIPLSDAKNSISTDQQRVAACGFETTQ
jgi:inner membrane protein